MEGEIEKLTENEAVVNLPPTASVELAGKLLAEMPVGGRTSLPAALVMVHKQVRNYLSLFIGVQVRLLQ